MVTMEEAGHKQHYLRLNSYKEVASLHYFRGHADKRAECPGKLPTFLDIPSF